MNDGDVISKTFSIDKAKNSRKKCIVCHKRCVTDKLRISILTPNLLGVERRKYWYHVHCIFKQFFKQRPTRKRIQCIQDIDGWENISEEDQNMLKQKIEESEKNIAKKYGLKECEEKAEDTKQICLDQEDIDISDNNQSMVSFKNFYDTVKELEVTENERQKCNIISGILKPRIGVDHKKQLRTWCKFLLPESDPRDCGLTNVELSRIFGTLFSKSHEDVLHSLENAENAKDVIDIIIQYFTENPKPVPAETSTLSLTYVDEFLEILSCTESTIEITLLFEAILRECTKADLRTLLLIMQRQLKINIAFEDILKQINPNAYNVYMEHQSIITVVNEYVPGLLVLPSLSVAQPMCTERVKSFEVAKKLFKNGMFCEVNFEGDRFYLIRRDGNCSFQRFSTEPRLMNKVSGLFVKGLVNQCVKTSKDIILECELVALVGNEGKMLSPRFFNSGHRNVDLKEVGLLIIDCVYLDGDISDKPLKERRDIITKNIAIAHNVKVSEAKIVHEAKHMNEMINKLISHNLDTLILKDINGTYDADRFKWLELHRDTVLTPEMGFTFDLVPVGAWGGVGARVDVKSTFLMGCYDTYRNFYWSVAKLPIDPDNPFTDQVQELKMERIYNDASRLPSWIRSPNMVPDFIAVNPQALPTWRVRCLEICDDYNFSSEIMMRYPHVVNLGDGQTSMTLDEIREIQQESRRKILESLQVLPSTSKQDTSLKRKADDSDEEITKRKAEEPVEDIVEETKQEVLPQYFQGLQLLLEPLVARICKVVTDIYTAKQIRNFEAHGGVVVPYSDYKSADYCLHFGFEEVQAKMDRNLKGLIHIHGGWIECSVKKKALQDVRGAMVVLVPSEEPDVAPTQ